jgi:hypothetical protein
MAVDTTGVYDWFGIHNEPHRIPVVEISVSTTLRSIKKGARERAPSILVQSMKNKPS